MRIATIPCWTDNYAYLIWCEKTGRAAVVDPTEAAAVEQELRKVGVTLEAILNTHHHPDHVDGNEELCKRHPGLRVYAHRSDLEKHRVPNQTVGLDDGSEVDLGELRARTWHIPGHTLGAIAYDFGPAHGVFTGDMLFLAGCGRVFEGTMAMMHDSLGRLARLPGNTAVYCGHEYTQKNLAFCLSLLPDDARLLERKVRVDAQCAKGEPTMGATLDEERATNVFLRVEEPAVVAAAVAANPGCDTSPVGVFSVLRGMKDRF